jgi:hypothetical protein
MKGLTKREAATRAGFSEALWRHLEAGRKEVYGRMVLPNPRRENLVSAARAVDLDPEVLLSVLGVSGSIAAGQSPLSDAASPLTDRIAALPARDQRVVEALVTALEQAQIPANPTVAAPSHTMPTEAVQAPQDAPTAMDPPAEPDEPTPTAAATGDPTAAQSEPAIAPQQGQHELPPPPAQSNTERRPMRPPQPAFPAPVT